MPNETICRIIAIGASAGGQGAFKTIIETRTSTKDAAVVLVQHLLPDHQILLPDLLSTTRPDLVIERGAGDRAGGGTGRCALSRDIEARRQVDSMRKRCLGNI